MAGSKSKRNAGRIRRGHARNCQEMLRLMNFYSHHIGDYLTRTAHLTLIEHGAYRRLIDVYYSTEAPLPADIKAVHRLVMARSKEEKDAVDSILAEFFDLEEDGFRQHRCDHEIALCDKNRINGKKGGRPKKTDNPNETQTEPRPNPNDNPNETQIEPNAKAPITRNPSTNKTTVLASAVSPPIATDARAEKPPPGEISPTARVCLGLKALEYGDTNPHDLKLKALLEAGLTPDEIIAVGEQAKGKGKGFSWILATAEGRRRDAAKVTPLPVAKPTESEASRASSRAMRGAI